MELYAYLVKDAIPSYLQNVPIPRSLRGFADLSFKDWIHLFSFTAITSGVGYLAIHPYYKQYKEKSVGGVINLSIRKDVEKVYDIVDVEDLGEKTSFCRCWRSKKFPFCDGSHNAHNAATGDNTASLVIKKNSRSD